MKLVNYAVGGLIALAGLACIAVTLWLPGVASGGDPMAVGVAGLIGVGLFSLGVMKIVYTSQEKFT